jgi:hypothetical protein
MAIPSHYPPKPKGGISTVGGPDTRTDSPDHSERAHLIPHTRHTRHIGCADPALKPGWIDQLNSGEQANAVCNGFQRAVASIHRYPYLLVIERTSHPPSEFVAPRFGTQWQPF